MKAIEQMQNSPKSGKKKRNLKNKVILNISFPEARRLAEKPTFAKNTKTPPNDDQINPQIKTKKI